MTTRNAVDQAAEAPGFEPIESPRPQGDRPRAVFQRGAPPSSASSETRPQGDGPRAASLDVVFPPHDFGSWPDGFSVRREEIY